MSAYLRKFQEIPEVDRKAESARIRAKYPDRCCVIVTKVPGSTAPDIDRHKYLVPGDLSVGQFIYVVRKRLRINPEKAIFLFIGGVLPPTSAQVGAVYEEKKSADGFLYVTYDSETTFG